MNSHPDEFSLSAGRIAAILLWVRIGPSRPGRPILPRKENPGLTSMKILTRYLFKDIFHYFWLFIAIFVVVLLVNQIYDQREDFMQNNPAMVDVVLLLLYGIPAMLAETLPMICLLSTIFAYGLLAKNREILAMVSSGLSFRSLALPAFVFGAGLTLFMFWFTESVVPTTQSRAKYIEEVKIKGKSESIFTKRKDLFVKGAGNRFYFMENYFSDRTEMVFPTILETSNDGGAVLKRIEADRGKLAAGEKGRQQRRG